MKSIAFIGPIRNELRDKLGWIANEWASTGLVSVVRGSTIEDVRKFDATCDWLIFEQFDAGLNHRDLIEASRDRKATWVQWWFDLIVRDGTSVGEQALFRQWRDVMQAMDLVLVKEACCVEQYKERGINASYVDQACPATMGEIERRGGKAFDAMIVGVNRPNRVAIAERLVKAGLRVAFVGSQATGGRSVPREVHSLPWTPPMMLPRVLEAAKCVISIDYRHDLNYCSDRLYLLAGTGSCVIHRGGGPRLIGVLGAGSDDDLVDYAIAVAQEQIDQSAMGKMARHHVLEYHTYTHRLHALGNILKRRGIK